MLHYFGTFFDFLIELVLGLVVDAFADQVVGPLLLLKGIPLAQLYGAAIHRHLSHPEPGCVWESWEVDF